MPNSRSRFYILLPALLVLGLILPACGGEDGDADSNSDQTGAQPIATVETPLADLTPTDAPVDPTSTAAPAEAQPTSDPGDAPEPTMVAGATAEEPAAAAPDPTATPEPVDESDDPAPELGSIDSWHNSPPLTLAELRGTPVLLVFWADY